MNKEAFTIIVSHPDINGGVGRMVGSISGMALPSSKPFFLPEGSQAARL